MPDRSSALGSSRQQPALPSNEAIHTKHVPTLKYVPKQLRTLWAQCVSRTLAGSVYHNDPIRLAEQQMLTKCVLCAPVRAGKQRDGVRAYFNDDNTAGVDDALRLPWLG